MDKIYINAYRFTKPKKDTTSLEALEHILSFSGLPKDTLSKVLMFNIIR